MAGLHCLPPAAAGQQFGSVVASHAVTLMAKGIFHVLRTAYVIGMDWFRVLKSRVGERCWIENDATGY